MDVVLHSVCLPWDVANVDVISWWSLHYLNFPLIIEWGILLEDEVSLHRLTQLLLFVNILSRLLVVPNRIVDSIFVHLLFVWHIIAALSWQWSHSTMPFAYGWYAVVLRCDVSVSSFSLAFSLRDIIRTGVLDPLWLWEVFRICNSIPHKMFWLAVSASSSSNENISGYLVKRSIQVRQHHFLPRLALKWCLCECDQTFLLVL